MSIHPRITKITFSYFSDMAIGYLNVKFQQRVCFFAFIIQKITFIVVEKKKKVFHTSETLLIKSSIFFFSCQIERYIFSSKFNFQKLFITKLTNDKKLRVFSMERTHFFIVKSINLEYLMFIFDIFFLKRSSQLTYD